MGRTCRKLHSYRFKKGNVPHNKGIRLADNGLHKNVSDYNTVCVRLSKDTFDRVVTNVNRDRSSSLLAGSGASRLLRPQRHVKPAIKNEQ